MTLSQALIILIPFSIVTVAVSLIVRKIKFDKSAKDFEIAALKRENELKEANEAKNRVTEIQAKFRARWNGEPVIVARINSNVLAIGFCEIEENSLTLKIHDQITNSHYEMKPGEFRIFEYQTHTLKNLIDVGWEGRKPLFGGFEEPDFPLIHPLGLNLEWEDYAEIIKKNNFNEQVRSHCVKSGYMVLNSLALMG